MTRPDAPRAATARTGSAELLPARVRIPASTSNLGAGFDCIGLALELHLDALYEPGGRELRVDLEGTLAGQVDRAADLVARTFREAFLESGLPVPGGHILARSGIPIGRGLGSSAAAIVAGLALAAAARARTLDLDAALALATRVEGHPDNAAPALLGGLVGVVREVGQPPRAFRLPLSGAVSFAWAAPAVEVSTAAARAALPGQVPHETATRALSRTAALLQGLATADPDLLRAGFDDELHVPWRLPLIPGAPRAMKAARAAGAWAVTISGSGSGLIAACPPGLDSVVAEAMGEAFRKTARDAAGRAGVIARALAPDLTGASILPI